MYDGAFFTKIKNLKKVKINAKVCYGEESRYDYCCAGQQIENIYFSSK